MLAGHLKPLLAQYRKARVVTVQRKHRIRARWHLRHPKLEPESLPPQHVLLAKKEH
jgi:hypothetical protein